MVDVIPSWTIRAMALILIVFSAGAFVIAAWRYNHLGIGRARPEIPAVPTAVVVGMSLVLAACSAMALLGLWLF